MNRNLKVFVTFGSLVEVILCYFIDKKGISPVGGSAVGWSTG
jgi:hypothetical protein